MLKSHYTCMPMIHLLPLSSKFTLHYLFCDNGLRPLKHPSFAASTTLRIIIRGKWEEYCKRKKLFPVPVCCYLGVFLVLTLRLTLLVCMRTSNVSLLQQHAQSVWSLSEIMVPDWGRWPFHCVPSDMDTSPACFCAALPSGKHLMPWFLLCPPVSTQVLQSMVSPTLGPAGCSSLCFCPLQSTLCPMLSSYQTPFLKLWTPTRCVAFFGTQLLQRTTSPTLWGMKWPPGSYFPWHLFQWFYSRSWDIAHPCKWLPQNPRQIPNKCHQRRASVISPSFIEPSPDLYKEVSVLA